MLFYDGKNEFHDLAIPQILSLVQETVKYVMPNLAGLKLCCVSYLTEIDPKNLCARLLLVVLMPLPQFHSFQSLASTGAVSSRAHLDFY